MGRENSKSLFDARRYEFHSEFLTQYISRLDSVKIIFTSIFPKSSFLRLVFQVPLLSVSPTKERNFISILSHFLSQNAILSLEFWTYLTENFTDILFDPHAKMRTILDKKLHRYIFVTNRSV